MDSDDINKKEILESVEVMDYPSEPYELHQFFLEHIVPDPGKSTAFIEKLKKHPNYELDAPFRVTVDAIALMMLGERNQNGIALYPDFLSKASAFELWFLVAHLWMNLAYVYSDLNMHEKALECYSRVIEVEKKHDLHSLTHVAYYNIGRTYGDVSDDNIDKVVESMNKAIMELQAHPPGEMRYLEKLFDYYLVLVHSYCQLKNIEKAKENYAKLLEIGTSKLSLDMPYRMAALNVVYYFLLYSYGECGIQDCRQAFDEAYRLLPEKRDICYYKLLSSYIKECFAYDIDFVHFEDVIQEMIACYPVGNETVDYTILEQAILYYEAKDDMERLDEFYRDFTNLSIKFIEEFRQGQRNTLNIVESLLINNPEKDDVSSQNLELKMLYRESMDAKARLDEAYQRIELINDLGRKLTSVMDLNDLIQSFNRILKNHIEFQTFSLFMVDKEANSLRSLIFEFNGALQPTLEISLDEDDSLNVTCYKTQKIMSVDNAKAKEMQKLEIYDGKNTKMRSAVYLPLIVNQEVIGVYTLQHSGENVYKDKLEFLEYLTPYMSIALNNAMKSWTLEKEIEAHVSTRSKLEEANSILENLSQVDGLTHISSRRFFEKKIHEMLEDSYRQNTELTMIMIDIDNFKKYNDTYGHLEGDGALRAVASVFKKEMERVGGLSARFGGEEFVGAVSHLSIEESRELGERIRTGVYDLGMEHRAAELGLLTVSIGLAYGRGLGVEMKSSMMRVADEMLYKAKKTGKNRVYIELCTSSK